MDEIQKIWSLPIPLLLETLNTTAAGLADDEALSRLKRNDHVVEKKQWVRDLVLLLSQFRSPLVLILIAAVILSFSLGDYANSSIITIIVCLTGLLGFWQERNAINKLKSITQVTATAKRAGKIKEIPFEEVVPGDIILLNAGDIIPGDGRLIECNDLHINEAVHAIALTSPIIYSKAPELLYRNKLLLR